MIFAFGFFRMFLVLIPVIVPLFLNLGITMQEFLILQAYFGIIVALFEVPSGYLSDMWGRKKTLVLGAVLNVSSIYFLYNAGGLLDLFVYQTIIAISFSMLSGADIAFLYDNDIGNQKNISNTQHKTNLMANYSTSKLLGETIAAVLGGLLAVYSFKYVILGQLVANLCMLTFALLLIEKPYEKMNKESHFKNFKETLSYLTKDSDILIIFTNLTVWSLSTFSAIWLFQKQWQNDAIDIKYFGYIWASYTLTSALFSKLASPIRNKIGDKASLLIISLFPLIGYIGMASTTSFVAALFGYMFAISRSFNYVFLRNELNLKIKSKFRATMNSIQSLFFRAGFFIIGPTLGYIVTKYNIQMGYISLLTLFSVSFLIFMVPLLAYKNWTPQDH